MNIRTILKSISALAVAIILSLFVGSTLGWSNNPDKSDAFQYAAKQMAQSGFYGTKEEVDAKFLEYAKKHPSYNAEEPTRYIAILKSNFILLGLFSFLGLALFRPPILGIILVFAPLAGISMFIINLMAGISILFFTIVFLGFTFCYSRLTSDRAT